MSPQHPQSSDNEMDETGENEEILEVIPLEDMPDEPIDEQDEEPDDSTHQIRAHEDDVLRMEVSKSSRWAATGSMDDTAAIWDLATDCAESHLRIEHVESVEYVAFDGKSELVATGDLKGKIVVTRLEDKKSFEIVDCLQETTSDDAEEALKFLFWHPSQSILFAGTSEGLIWAWSVTNLEATESKIFACSTNQPVVAAKLIQATNQLVSAYEDGFLRVWDVETTAKKELSLGNMLCVELDVNQKANLAAVGMEDGTVVMVNIGQNKVVARFGDVAKKQPPETDQNQPPSITSLSFHPENHPWLAVGKEDGTLTIYDYTSNSQRATVEHQDEAIVSLLWRKSSDGQPYLISATVNGKIRVMDARNGQVLKQLSAGVEIFELATVEKQGLKLLAACGGGQVKIFEP